MQVPACTPRGSGGGLKRATFSGITMQSIAAAALRRELDLGSICCPAYHARRKIASGSFDQHPAPAWERLRLIPRNRYARSSESQRLQRLVLMNRKLDRTGCAPARNGSDGEIGIANSSNKKSCSPCCFAATCRILPESLEQRRAGYVQHACFGSWSAVQLSVANYTRERYQTAISV
jgi:hypothetical protein